MMLPIKHQQEVDLVGTLGAISSAANEWRINV